MTAAHTAAPGTDQSSCSPTTPRTTPADGVSSSTEPGRGGADRAGSGRRRTSRCSSPTIGRQLLELGLIDEIDLHHRTGPARPGHPAVGQPRQCADPPPPGRRRRPHLGGQRTVLTPPQRRRSRPEPGTTASSSRGRSLVLPPRPGWRIWPDGAGMPDPQPQAPHQPTRHPSRPLAGEVIDGRLRWLCRLPLAAWWYATVSTVPQVQGQADRPARQQQRAIHGSAVDLASLACSQPSPGSRPRATVGCCWPSCCRRAVDGTGSPFGDPVPPKACPPWSPQAILRW